MSVRPLPVGKLPAPLLRRLLASAPPLPAEVLLPPAIGEDAGVIGIGGGALVVATDPITLTGRGIGGHAVIVNANDVAVMGLRPRWFLAVLLLPVGTGEDEVAALFDDMSAALQQLDVALVGGHTEVTTAVTRPVVIGQMLGFDAQGRFIRSAGVRPGDAILQVGPAPIEAAAVLANEAGSRLQGVSPALLAKARRAVAEPGISVVEAALLAADAGATAMHDPTEGGLSAGLHELAEASGLGFRVDADAVLWFEPGRAVCAALGADPWGALASGALLAAFPEPRLAAARARLEAAGHRTAVLARAEAGAGLSTLDGRPLTRYEQDEVGRVLAG
jgi:hydrogenase maturation factor